MPTDKPTVAETDDTAPAIDEDAKYMPPDYPLYKLWTQFRIKEDEDKRLKALGKKGKKARKAAARAAKAAAKAEAARGPPTYYEDTLNGPVFSEDEDGFDEAKELEQVNDPSAVKRAWCEERVANSTPLYAGLNYMRRGKLGKAIALFSLGIDRRKLDQGRDPESQLYFYRGQCRLRCGLAKRAKKDFDHLCENYATLASAFEQRGIVRAAHPSEPVMILQRTFLD